MTKKELNLRIARLYRVYKKAETIEDRDSLSKELVRLYKVDRTFEYVNHKNLLRMLVMNLSLRAVSIHQFGIQISEKEL